MLLDFRFGWLDKLLEQDTYPNPENERFQAAQRRVISFGYRGASRGHEASKVQETCLRASVGQGEQWV